MNNISYAEAVKKVQGQKGAEDISQSQIFRAGQRGQGNRTTEMAMEKFILFVAYVINCADQTKHKSEKIKIIVRVAEKFLDMRDLSWEQITRRLEAEGKPGGLERAE